jgi:hypothetical protein
MDALGKLRQKDPVMHLLREWNLRPLEERERRSFQLKMRWVFLPLIIGAVMFSLLVQPGGSKAPLLDPLYHPSPLKQTLPAGDSHDFPDTDNSDVDLSPSIGTHSDFSAQQAFPDSTNDILTESNTGNPAASEWLDVNSLDGTWSGWETNGTSPYLNAQDAPTGIIFSKLDNRRHGWFDFANTTLTGTLNVNISVYCKNDNGEGNDAIEVYVDYTGSGAGSLVGIVGQHNTYSYDVINLGAHNASVVNALRVYLVVDKVGGADEVYADHVRLGVNNTNYELDLEVQWTNPETDELNEELCIFTGSTDGENISVDVWHDSAWQRVIQDLEPDSWNNVSVASFLDSSEFTIRFKGSNESGDLTQSSWQIDSALLHTWSPNYAPQNEQSPTVSNIDDTDRIYARYKEYQITVYVSDSNGYEDIDHLELTLTSNNQSIEYWTVRYDNGTNSFSEQTDLSDYIELNAVLSSASRSGNDINATFHIMVNWNHPFLADSDAKW